MHASRILYLLQEIFDPRSFEWTVFTDGNGADFHINYHTYDITGSYTGNDKNLYILFSNMRVQEKPTREDYKDLLVILSLIRSLIERVREDYDVQSIEFSGEKRRPSLIKLYNHIAQRIAREFSAHVSIRESGDRRSLIYILTFPRISS